MHRTYTQTFRISSYDLNPNASARLTSLANYLQEMAYQHAKRLKWGFHDMEERNTAWVLSKFKIVIHRLPGWDELITIETWPRGVERLFAMRDFRVTDESGAVIVDATTSWLVVDIVSHRPVRIPADIMEVTTREDSVFLNDSIKIPLPEGMSSAYTRKVGYSDLDIVGHVNNVRYMEWCLDSISLEKHMNKVISAFEINFLGEAKYGSEIELKVSNENEDLFIINALNTETQKECVRARLWFK